MKQNRVNNQIRASQVRVIDENGKQLGVMITSQALALAYQRHLDLIEVAAKVSPPVCKIVDLGKFLYQKEKQARGHKPKRVEVKEIRLSFNIAKHDLEMKAVQAQKFLAKGDRAKIQIILRGREKAFASLAKKKLEEFLKTLTIPFNLDQPILKEPRGFSLVISKGK